MNWGRLTCLLVLLSMVFIWNGCEDDPVSSPEPTVTTSKYFPMDLQRTWNYNGFIETRAGELVVTQEFTEVRAISGTTKLFGRDCIEFTIEYSLDPSNPASKYYYTADNALYAADLDTGGWELVLDFDDVPGHTAGDTLNAVGLDTTAAEYEILTLLAHQEDVTLETRTYEMCIGMQRESHLESGALDIETYYFSYGVGLAYYEHLHYNDAANDFPSKTLRDVLTGWSSVE